jgi:hypothetical protein
MTKNGNFGMDFFAAKQVFGFSRRQGFAEKRFIQGVGEAPAPGCLSSGVRKRPL